MKTRVVIITVICILLFTSAPLHAQKEFPEWSLEVYSEIKRRVDEAQGAPNGAMAFARLYDMWIFINIYLNDPVRLQITEVNNYMNALTWIADVDLWKRTDYWATPFETLTTFGGDCEDIAIAKYAVLRLMGVSENHMAFAHVVTAQKEHHMVLVYIGPKGKESLILDNQYPDVMPAEARSDLIGVYMFQDKAYEEDEVRLIILKDNVIARQTLKDRKDNFMLKKWVDVKKRARDNIKSLIPFNDGRPLLPRWVREPG